jgi:hypothetical protein
MSISERTVQERKPGAWRLKTREKIDSNTEVREKKARGRK